jgi:hypothetical protein
MRSIQEIWAEGKCHLVNGIIHANGIVTPIELDRSNQGHHLRGRLVVGCTTNLADLKNSGSLEHTFHTEMCEVVDDLVRLRVVGGGAGMGGDGFVAVLRLPGDILEWIAFFDFANPFVSVQIINQSIKAVNNLGEEWSFPISAPERVAISQQT